MDIVAEGIETEIEAEMMTQFGCTKLQGYYFSRPLEADALDALRKSFRPMPIVAEEMRARSAS
jgi:EAL domain-containing protein (putative c-di-GMP-specific phosphodiesterase class I)